MAGSEHTARPGLLRAALAVAVAAGAFGTAGAAADEAEDDARAGSPGPNIVVVIADDQTADMFNKRTMPFTRRTLGKGGTTFTDAVVTSPFCCPSRASFLTGQYTHNHGAWNSYRTFDRPREQLASWLGAEGYRTAMVGKYLNHYEDSVNPGTRPGLGWDQWRMLLEPLSYYDYDVSVNGRRVHKGSSDKDYATSYLNRQATDLVDRWARKAEPFFLWYAPHAPHDEKQRSKGSCAGRAVPAPGDEDLFAHTRLPRPPSFDEGNVSDKPKFMKRLPRLWKDDVDEMTRRYRCRLASLREIDRGVAGIARELRRRNELDDSVIVFTSDNGLFHGEHRLRDGKRLPYAEAVEVPLVARIPSSVAGGPTASRVVRPVANIDLAPTLLDLAGAGPCSAPGRCRVMDGRSMVPLILGNAGAWPRDRGRILEMRNCRYTSLLTTEELVVHHISTPRRAGRRGCTRREAYERYDMVDDPFQLHSRAKKRGDIPDPLRLRLNRTKDCVGIEGRDPAPPPGRTYCE